LQFSVLRALDIVFCGLDLGPNSFSVGFGLHFEHFTRPSGYVSQVVSPLCSIAVVLAIGPRAIHGVQYCQYMFLTKMIYPIIDPNQIFLVFLN